MFKQKSITKISDSGSIRVYKYITFLNKRITPLMFIGIFFTVDEYFKFLDNINESKMFNMNYL